MPVPIPALRGEKRILAILRDEIAYSESDKKSAGIGRSGVGVSSIFGFDRRTFRRLIDAEPLKEAKESGGNSEHICLFRGRFHYLGFVWFGLIGKLNRAEF
jgi:hypothetical protein